VYVQRVDIRREPRETELHPIRYREDLREIYSQQCIHDIPLPTICSVAHLYIHSSDTHTHICKATTSTRKANVPSRNHSLHPRLDFPN
jgi:hypothetical protein